MGKKMSLALSSKRLRVGGKKEVGWSIGRKMHNLGESSMLTWSVLSYNIYTLRKCMLVPTIVKKNVYSYRAEDRI